MDGDDAGLTATGTITLLLNQVREGQAGARDELFDCVYSDLRKIAQHMIDKAGWPRGGLEGTALVSAACERLLGRGGIDAENRRHFFYVFGRAMHDVLVERARGELALKRGGQLRQVPLIGFEVDGELTRTTVLDLHDALAALRKVDERSAEVVELRFFSGRTLEEVAELTGQSFGSVRRDWEYARAWLHVRLSSYQGNDGGPPG
jgi:RNA polymerase sigma factor (TIGR02999 family)